jgi:hypothetical protein
MGAGLVQRSDPRGLARAIQPDPVKIALCRILRRCQEIDVSLLFIDMDHADHIEVTGSQTQGWAGLVHWDDLEPPPAVAVGRPRKRLATADPFQIVVNVDPGIVTIDEQSLHSARTCTGKQDAQLVLAAIKTLQKQLVGCWHPLHADDVVLPWLARKVEPPCGAPAGRNHPDPGCRIVLSALGIAHRDDLGIKPRGGVEQRVLRNVGIVDLPVRDLPAVGAEAISLVQKKLLLVDPIKRAVDAAGRAVG